MKDKAGWKKFKAAIKGVKYRSEQDWELFIPYDDTTRKQLDIIFSACRNLILPTWHLKHPILTEENPELKPESRMYWD